MFELVFLFTGLCGYALDPAPSGDAAEGLDVVIPDAADHEARLVVEQGRIEKQRTTVTFVESCYKEGEHCVVDLHRKIVRLRDPEGNGGTDVKWDVLSGSPKCPDAENARSYGWTVPMSVATPGKGRLRDELRWPSRDAPPELRSLIQLENGQLSNVSFSRDEHGEIIRWRLGRGPMRRRIRRALGDRVELRQGGWRQDVVIEIIDIESRKIDLLWLTPPPQCADGNQLPVLLVEVFHTRPEDICKGAPYRPEKDTPSEMVNAHFPLLYGLLPANAVKSTPKADKDGDDDRCPSLPELEPDIRCAASCIDPKVAPGNPYCPGADTSGP